jgi:hypothetical protein
MPRVPSRNPRRMTRRKISGPRQQWRRRSGPSRLTAELLRERAGDARLADLLPYLDVAPDVEPGAGDEA